MKRFHTTLRLLPVCAALAMALCALPPASAASRERPERSFAEMTKGLPLIPAGREDSEMLANVTEAVGFIQRLDLPQA